MEKKLIKISIAVSAILLILIIVLSIGGKKAQLERETTEIRNICELATIRTYYTNVVKHTQPAEEGFKHIGEKDRKIWIEYTGWADVGIKMESVDIEVNGDKVIVYMPKAEVLDKGIEELSKDGYKMTKDSWFNKNPISTKKQSKLVDEGQKNMELTIEQDETIINQAQDRAKELIENHIKRMGQMARKEYEIEWVIR